MERASAAQNTLDLCSLLIIVNCSFDCSFPPAQKSVLYSFFVLLLRQSILICASSEGLTDCCVANYRAIPQNPVPHVSNIVEESNFFYRNCAAASYKTFVSGRRSTAQRSHVNSSLPGIQTLSICLQNPRLPRNRRSQRKHSSPRRPVVSYCVPNPQREICNIHFLNEEGSSKMSSK